jgi:hypothetical protein
MALSWRKKRIVLIIAVCGISLAACGRKRLDFSGPIPEPHDIESPAVLDGGLAKLRIPWNAGAEEHQSLRLDGSDPIPLIPGCGMPSPSGRYVICDPYFGSSLELLDLSNRERRVLVSREDIHPTAQDLSYANFTADESEVVFTVTWENGTDPAFVDLETGRIELIDAPGIFNSDPVVSPDGSWILVSCEGIKPGAGFVLCLIDRETKERVRLLDEVTNIPRTGLFTPDGKFIVYTAPFGSSMGEGRLYRIDVDDRSTNLLVSGLHSTDGVLGVTSSEVVFTCRNPDRPACSWVCVVDLEGKDVRRLTYLGESCLDLDSP